MRNTRNVPTGDFVLASRPLVAGHPYRGFIEAYAVDPSADRDQYAAILGAMSVPDVDLIEAPYIWSFRPVDPARTQQLFTLLMCHGDLIYRDLVGLLKVLGGSVPEASRRLQGASPFAPQAKARLVESDWPTVEPLAREWEDGASDQADVLLALGRRYAALKRWDDAGRCLEKAVALSPDGDNFVLLASTYKERGDVGRWRATLERAPADDPGLGAMKIQVELADRFMALKQWDEALPHALAAAETWAYLGIQSAAWCYEGMGDWANAELWVRRGTERYPDSAWAWWFMFCKRTSHGDLAGARDFALQYLSGRGDQPADHVRRDAFHFHLVDGSTARALAMLRSIDGASRYPIEEVINALLADEQGDAAGRDRILDALGDDPRVEGQPLAGLVRAIRGALASPPGASLETAPFSEALNALPVDDRHLIAIFVARFAHARGAADKAKAWMRHCVDVLGKVGWAQALAVETLREWERAGAP